jgi:hypothetical protein
LQIDGAMGDGAAQIVGDVAENGAAQRGLIDAIAAVLEALQLNPHRHADHADDDDRESQCQDQL